MIDWYKHPKYLPDDYRDLQEAEGAYALREAWYRVYGNYPSDRSWAVLWAKACLETGRFKEIHCSNFGNIKRKENDNDRFFTMYECGEEVALSQAQKLVNEDPERIKILSIYSRPDGARRASIHVKVGHLWSQFRAYKTVEDGAEDYIRFVSQNTRYAEAWKKVIAGDPAGYSQELSKAGYYTGSVVTYTTGVVRLYNEFLKRKEEFMSWKPEAPDTDPAPPPVSEPDISDTIPAIEDIHDTDSDIDNSVVEIKTDTIKANPLEQKPKTNVGLIILIAGCGAVIAWFVQLFQGC